MVQRFTSVLESVPLQWLLPATFCAVGLLYWYAAPNFEASDTVQHVGMVKWIAERPASCRGNRPIMSICTGRKRVSRRSIMR